MNLNPFTQHPNDTDHPEGYWVHFRRSFVNGWTLIWAGVTSIIHAVCPWWYQFYTAETVVRLWADLHMTGRHDALLDRWETTRQRNVRRLSKANPVYTRPPQAEPAEVEAHPSHNWQPGNKGPRDE